MTIRLAYLYPELMNLYGDKGNILCLEKRCYWRGIEIEIKEVSLGDSVKSGEFDLFFGGGGQDKEQVIVADDLKKKKAVLEKEAERGVPMLLICGSYQLFGHYFKTFTGKKIPGISIFDGYTIASKKRKIGDVVVKPTLNSQLSALGYLVGFENHSGNTFITKVKSPAFARATAGKQKSKVQPSPGLPPSSRLRWTGRQVGKTYPLGKIIKGYGNNGQDKTEGAVYNNVIGTYLHGPVLPKNPSLADFLIQKALAVKYQKKIKLEPLDDRLEEKARGVFLHRFLPLKYKLYPRCLEYSTLPCRQAGFKVE